MRQLLPFPCDPVDAAALYGDLPSARTRPAVRLNMIASIDGATAVAGVSGGLGCPADQALFAVLRSQADVVLVAAGTVRAEHYGPLAVPVAVPHPVPAGSTGILRSLPPRSRRRSWSPSPKRPALERKKAADLADVIIAGERDVWIWRPRSAHWPNEDMPACSRRAARL